MEFVPLYPNVVAFDGYLANLITMFSDGQYQAGALLWANEGEPLEPYKLISESAVWREDEKTPALIIGDVTTESRETGGPMLDRVHRFSVYQCLALVDDHEALMHEAYRRLAAVEMMIRSAQLSGYDLFAGTQTSPGSPVITLHPGDTSTGKAPYFRFPYADVELPTLEA